ncbi:hypothetical protein Csa_015689 [Cucumis sativus]|uniref:Uncharacterized protein n=1 Tax=Cucumis sativus TaxID=3659 RepID=A0A0A0K5E9_CUCSA|nr:hypothetical protein Csa_015689 [Cucumis sativus]
MGDLISQWKYPNRKSKFSFLTGIGSSIQPKFYSKPCNIKILQHHSSEILAFGFSGPFIAANALCPRTDINQPNVLWQFLRLRNEIDSSD